MVGPTDLITGETCNFISDTVKDKFVIIIKNPKCAVNIIDRGYGSVLVSGLVA